MHHSKISALIKKIALDTSSYNLDNFICGGYQRKKGKCKLFDTCVTMHQGLNGCYGCKHEPRALDSYRKYKKKPTCLLLKKNQWACYQCKQRKE